MADIECTDEPMGAAEARNLTDVLRAAMTQAWKLIDELDRRRGWLALGYHSLNEWGERELGYSGNYTRRLANVAQVAYALPAEAVLSESQARELFPLKDAEAIRSVWDTVSAESDGAPRAKALRTTAREMFPHRFPKPKAKPPKNQDRDPQPDAEDAAEIDADDITVDAELVTGSDLELAPLPPPADGAEADVIDVEVIEDDSIPDLCDRLIDVLRGDISEADAEALVRLAQALAAWSTEHQRAKRSERWAAARPWSTSPTSGCSGRPLRTLCRHAGTCCRLSPTCAGSDPHEQAS